MDEIIGLFNTRVRAKDTQHLSMEATETKAASSLQLLFETGEVLPKHVARFARAVARRVKILGPSHFATFYPSVPLWLAPWFRSVSNAFSTSKILCSFGNIRLSIWVVRLWRRTVFYWIRLANLIGEDSRTEHGEYG